MDIKERIKEYMSLKKITPAEFERNSSLSNGYMKNLKSSIGADKLNGIVTHYTDLNIDWLITGKGDMLKSRLSGNNEDYSVSNNSGGTNQGGSDNINISSPAHGTQKIIHADKSMEIETSSQHEDVSSLKNENELLKSRISELEDIIARQNRVIDKLTL